MQQSELPEDICECGDYRRQHQENGKCAVCGDSKLPWDGCQEFRFAWRTLSS